MKVHATAVYGIYLLPALSAPSIQFARAGTNKTRVHQDMISLDIAVQCRCGEAVAQVQHVSRAPQCEAPTAQVPCIVGVASDLLPAGRHLIVVTVFIRRAIACFLARSSMSL